MTIADILRLGEEVGFSHVYPMEPGTLRFLPEVRQMCAADKCRSYGKNWSCPPHCGSIEDFGQRASQYTTGILLQSTGEMEDDFDFETMMETEALHKQRFYALTDTLRTLCPDFFAMSAGACSLCESCACPEEPCRNPEKLYYSMEACGLMVSDTCRDAGVPYYYGPGTITYTSLILFNENLPVQ